MAARETVPGTWRTTISLGAMPTFKGILAFTSDGIVVQVTQPRTESALGAWEPGEEEDKFTFVLLGFEHDLLPPPAPPILILRVRSTDNTLLDDDRLEGTATVELLDVDTEAVLVTTPSKVAGVRLKV